MARPLRFEFPGALYHVTSRGKTRQDIFEDDEDRRAFHDLLRNSCDRQSWYCQAYCLMSKVESIHDNRLQTYPRYRSARR